jgi:hypothetical protein
MSVHLFDKATEQEIGLLSDEQFRFLQEHLEAEDADDDDYYIDQATLDLLDEQGGDPLVLEMLRTAMGSRADMDVRWRRDDPEQAAGDDATTGSEVSPTV